MNDFNSFRGFRGQPMEDPLEPISNKLDTLRDIQAATEMVAESVEDQGNKISDVISDDVAANELTAENTENTAKNTGRTVSELQKLNDFSLRMNDKLKSFSAMMEKKFTAVPKINDGVEAIENALSVPEQPTLPTMPSPAPLLPEVIQPPTPTIVKPDQGDSKDNAKEKKQRGDERPQRKDKKKESDNAALLNAIKGGFKQTVAVSDRIFSTLFKLTLTAMVEFVKWGAILMGIIFAIDSVTTIVKYWFDKFSNNFSGFLDQAGKWAGTLTNIFSTFQEVRDYFISGKYVEAIKSAFIGAIGVVRDALNALDIAIGELGVKILRAVRLGDIADKMEANVIERKAQLGMELSPEEKVVYAKVQTEKEREQLKEDTTDKRTWGGLGRTVPGKTDEQLTARQREIKAVDENTQKHSAEATIGARSDLNQLFKNLDAMYASPENKSKIEILKSRADDVKKRIESDPGVLSSDRSKIDDLYKAFMNTYNSKLDTIASAVSKVKPVSAHETEQATQATRIETQQIALTAPAAAPATTANVNNTQIVTNNRTIRHAPPQTSTQRAGLIQQGVV